MTVGALDADLGEEFAFVERSQLAFYVSFGGKLLDVLVLSAGQNAVKVPLTGGLEKLSVIVKSLGRDEVKVGSVSVPQATLLGAGEGRHKQWITLFDHLDDDEFDGEMGENDDEAPRVRLSLAVSCEAAQKSPLREPLVKKPQRDKLGAGNPFATKTTTPPKRTPTPPRAYSPFKPSA